MLGEAIAIHRMSTIEMYLPTSAGRYFDFEDLA